MVVYDKKYPAKSTLKKRGMIYNKLPCLHFGDTGIILKKSIRFEFIYFLFMRKFLKKVLRQKKRANKARVV